MSLLSLVDSLLNLSVRIGSLQVANGANVNGAGNDTIIGGDNDTISLSGGGNSLFVHDYDTITIGGGGNTVTMHDSCSLTIAGGGNNVSMHDNDSLTINDTRSLADGFSGAVTFGDTISGHKQDTIALNYSLNLGNSDAVTIGCTTSVSGLSGGSFSANGVVNAGRSDVLTFAGANEAITLNATAGDTISTTGSNDTITIGNSAIANSSAATGGACSNGIIMTVSATAAGTTLNGGLGTDTFSAGAGYDGGNHYIGSLGSQSELFSGAGNCVNYSGLACRVSVNYNTGVGQGYDSSGNLLWTDTYTDMEQVKGARLDGNVLTGSNQYFNELKGGLGQTTYYDGTPGDRIIWGEAGATGLDDGQGTDVAYLGGGNDELYWRNQPTNSKGVSNFGETAFGFNTAQADDLNFSELSTAGYAGVARSFAGTAADATNWVNVSLAANGQDTDVWVDKSGSGNFAQVAMVLKNENLFSAFGVTDTSAVGAQQVLQDLYNTGHLVLNQTH
jgi:hypothetical protein